MPLDPNYLVLIASNSFNTQKLQWQQSFPDSVKPEIKLVENRPYTMLLNLYTQLAMASYSRRPFCIIAKVSVLL